MINLEESSRILILSAQSLPIWVDALLVKMVLSPSPQQEDGINRAQCNCDWILMFRENINMKKRKKKLTTDIRKLFI